MLEKNLLLLKNHSRLGQLLIMKNATLILLVSTSLLALLSAYLFPVALAQKATSNITCEVSPQTIIYGEYANISGRLTDLLTGQGLKRLVNLTYSEDDGVTWKQLKVSWDELTEWGINDIWTTDDGYFGPYKWGPEHIPHNFLIKAFWGGDEQYEPSESTVTLKVNLPPSPPVLVLSHNSRVSIDTFWVAGEVQNVGTTNLEWVEVTIVYYDIFEKIIGVDDIYADLHLLAPRENSSFITFAGIDYEEAINASLIANYVPVIGSYQNTTEEPYRNFQILNEISWFDEFGGYHVSGELKNTGTLPVYSVDVVATFYSAEGKVVDAWWDTRINYSEILNPDETILFDIELYRSRYEAVGVIDHYVLQVDSYPVSVSCYVFPSKVGLGESVEVSGHISPFLEMANVTLTYVKPDLTSVTRTVWTDAYGYYNDTFTPDTGGTWTVYAYWLGDGLHPGVVSSNVSFTVSKTMTLISCFVSLEKIQLGENIVITGSISPTLDNVSVTLTFTKPDNSTLTQTVTLVQGNYSYTFKPDSSGSWRVKAGWPGNNIYEGANSSLTSFTVSKTTTSISCSVSSEKIQLGENIVITGSISPTIESASVTLTFTKPDNSTLAQTATLVQGNYSSTFKPDSSGSWRVKASWPGNNIYEGANSTLKAFTVEFLAPVREVPPPENTAVAIVVGTGVTVGVTASMSLSGLAQSFDGAVSKLPAPKWLKDFLNLYAEKTFETLTKEQIKALKSKKILTLRELLSLLFSAIILLAVFVYVEVNGVSNFLNREYLLAAVPQVLISVVFVFVTTQIFSIISAKALNVWSEFKIWLYGLTALLITGIIFMIPFASPGRVEYQGDIDRKKAGLTATSKVLCILVLSIPFYLFYTFGFTTIGDAGLMMTMMTACYTAFPFKPLEGEAIFRYHKGLWIAIFFLSFSMFVCTILSLLPRVAYLLTGAAATLLFVGLILTLRRAKSPIKED